MVLVRLFVYFPETAGRKEITLSADTVDKLMYKLFDINKKIHQLIVERTKPLKLKPDIMVLVNSRNIWSLNGLRTKLKKKDIVSILPVFCGG